jgi:hypothetical protein
MLAVITEVSRGHAGNELPGGSPAYPGNALPGGPPAFAGTLPAFPPQINPPPPEIWPGVPVHPLPPNQTLPVPPGTIYPPLPPHITGKVVALVWIVGVGHRWAVLDADARPEPK